MCSAHGASSPTNRKCVGRRPPGNRSNLCSERATPPSWRAALVRDPGQFKQISNRAGQTVFVSPDLVRGTLAEGFDFVRSLETPFQRAVFLQFVVSEIHPFADGNGRMARIMMNAELVAGGEERIVIPTIYRDSYFTALRALSRNGICEPLIGALAFAQRWTAAVDWRSVTATRRELLALNAFVDPLEAEAEGRRLRMPGAEPVA